MKEIRIKVDNDMSKQDEIEIMHKLRDTFGKYPNNYLSNLFSMNFTQWIENQIRDDFSADAYEHFCGWECDDAKRKLETANEIYDKLLTDTNEQAIESEQKIKKLISNRDELIKQFAQAERDYEILLNETADTEDKLQKKIGCLEHEIIILKAKLYDKITK